MAKKDPTTRKPEGQTPATPAMAEDALRRAQDAVSSLKEQASAPAAPAAFTPGIPMGAPVVGAQPGGAPVDAPLVGLNAEAAQGIELLSDVNLNVKIELGRTRMLVEDVLRLSEGAVVELDKLAGDPVDVYVNDRPVARGEVLVLNDNFCVRINEIIAVASDAERAPGLERRGA